MRVLAAAIVIVATSSAAFAQAQAPSTEDYLANDVAILSKRNAQLNVMVGTLTKQVDDLRKELADAKKPKVEGPKK